MKNVIVWILIPIQVIIVNSVQSTMQEITMTDQSAQNIHIKALTGSQAREYLDDIIRIRFTLFKEYPYLYEGTLAYERDYLETYLCSDNAAILLAFADNKLVGFSNSLPLSQEVVDIKAPFINRGLNINNYLYIGEVMIYTEYRGKGLARKFLEFHESKARKEGYSHTVFMTVERPDDHPSKPHTYQSLDSMWQHFGYVRISDLLIHFVWKQIDTSTDVDNVLAIWQKNIC